MTFCILYYWIGTKFRALKRLSRASGTLVSRKFGHLLVTVKLEGKLIAVSYNNVYCVYGVLFLDHFVEQWRR